MPKYEDRAVEALHAVLASAQLTDQLRAVEVREGLNVGDLTDPVDVVSTPAPFDNRSPLIQVYDSDSVYPEAGQRQGVLHVGCEVLLSYTGDAQLEATERFMRRYMTALRDTIADNPVLRVPTLADQPAGDITAAIITGSDTAAFGDESTTRFHRALFVTVHVHTP